MKFTHLSSEVSSGDRRASQQKQHLEKKSKKLLFWLLNFRGERRQKLEFSFFFWPHCAACGILVPRPGIEPVPPAVERGVLTTGPPGKSPKIAFSILNDKCFLSLPMCFAWWVI